MSQGMSYVTVMLTAGSHLVCVYKLQPTTGFFFLHTPHFLTCTAHKIETGETHCDVCENGGLGLF